MGISPPGSARSRAYRARKRHAELVAQRPAQAARYWSVLSAASPRVATSWPGARGRLSTSPITSPPLRPERSCVDGFLVVARLVAV